MKVLVVWDRIGDYHRKRIRAYVEMYQSDMLITANLGAGSDIYKWTNDNNASHIDFSSKSADKFDLFKRYNHFKRVVTEYNIDKVVLSG